MPTFFAATLNGADDLAARQPLTAPNTPSNTSTKISLVIALHRFENQFAARFFDDVRLAPSA
jgi:hypothetical protein